MSQCQKRPAIVFLAAWFFALWAMSSPAPAEADDFLAGSWPNMTTDEVSKSFWKENGPLLPRREFVEAVQAASFSAMDGRGRQRRLVVLSIASEYTFTGLGLWELFLTNLRNITFTRRDGSQDHLARHLVANFMTLPNATADTCNRISNPYGARCVPITSPIFTADNYGYKTPPFYGLSFAKTLTILDALTLGVDVFFLDGDQVFFRNPLPYLLARDIDVLVSGDCQQRLDTVPQISFPRINSNIGVLYFRSSPMTTRAVANWLAFMVARGAAGQPILDQSSFTGAMEWVSMSLGPQAMSVAMLRGEYFPHWCMGPCGCDTEGVPLWEVGLRAMLLPDGTCDIDLMRGWYNFHVPCVPGDMNKKAEILMNLLFMYQNRVGPVNSLSEPMDVL